jgi:hypothetical protein
MRAPPLLLQRILEAVPSVLAERFSPDCCLNASRILLEACRAVGIPRARELAVAVCAANNVATRYALDGSDGPPPEGYYIVICDGRQVPDDEPDKEASGLLEFLPALIARAKGTES